MNSNYYDTECPARMGFLCHLRGGSVSCMYCSEKEIIRIHTNPWIWLFIILTWSAIAGAIFAIFNFCAYACS